MNQEEIVFPKYSVILTENSITYKNNSNGSQVRISSEFRIKFRKRGETMETWKESFEIYIENIYMKLYCWLPHEKMTMFDFIGRGYNVFDSLFKEL